MPVKPADWDKPLFSDLGNARRPTWRSEDEIVRMMTDLSLIDTFELKDVATMKLTHGGWASNSRGFGKWHVAIQTRMGAFILRSYSTEAKARAVFEQARGDLIYSIIDGKLTFDLPVES